MTRPSPELVQSRLHALVDWMDEQGWSPDEPEVYAIFISGLAACVRINRTSTLRVMADLQRALNRSRA